jgi:multifunctional beta-oxidation protein
MGLVGFTKTLALEGAKYNIKVNAIAPVSARFGWRYLFFLNLCIDCCLRDDCDDHAARDVATLRCRCSSLNVHLYLSHYHSQPEYVAPLVAAITHPDGPDSNGKVFVLGAGYITEIRWERSRGVVFKTDGSFTPSAVGTALPLSSCPSAPEHFTGKRAMGGAHRF